MLTTAHTRALGWRRHDIRRELRRGTWWVPAVGVLSPVAPGELSDMAHKRRAHALVTAAAALNRPDHIAALRSAAILHRLPTMTVPDVAQLISLNGASTGRQSTAHIRAGRVRPAPTPEWFGVPVCGVARTVVDLARGDRRDGLMAADVALRECGLTPAAVDREVRLLAGESAAG